MGRYIKPERSHYLVKGAIMVKDKNSSAVAYIYERLGKPYAMLFVGKQAKPLWHYRFKDAAARQKRIADGFASIAASEKARAESRAAAKARNAAVQYKVGDVFRNSWGYDQTNVNYYQVISVKGRYVTVREIESHAETNNSGAMSGKCVPAIGCFKGPEKRCLMQDGRIKTEYGYAWYEAPTMVAGMPIYGATHWSSYA